MSKQLLGYRGVLLAVATALIASLTGIFAYLETVRTKEDVLAYRRASMHEIYQLQEHYTRFMRSIVDHAHGFGEADHDMLMLRFDILWSRMGPIASNEIIDILGVRQALREKVGIVQQALDAVEDRVLTLELGDIATARTIVDELDDVGPVILEIRHLIDKKLDEIGIRETESIVWIQRTQLILFLVTLSAGTLLCLFILRQAIKARRMARHDALTGALNRATLTSILSDCMEQSAKCNAFVAFYLLDIDRFKSINDVLGLACGDAILIEISRRLTATLGQAGHVFRLGCDEFAVIVTGLGEFGEVERWADRLLSVAEAPISIESQNLALQLTLGYCAYPSDGSSSEKLIKRADIALRAAKSSGGRCARPFSLDLEQRAVRFRYLEKELRNALANDQLQVHYQAKYCLRTGRIVGAEALARWHHESEGLIRPDEFISVAEACGLIDEVGEAVLRRACLDAASWSKMARWSVPVAVNVSARQFERADLVQRIDQILEKRQLPAELLELEVTESVMFGEKQLAIKILEQIKQRGICIALDDFGTGYASLSHLREFSFDKLKIDRSFIQDLDRYSSKSPFVEAIVTMAKGLRLEIVAEGIESDDIARRLAEMGCDEGQGFGLSKPEPFESFLSRLRHAQRRPAMVDSRAQKSVCAGDGAGLVSL